MYIHKHICIHTTHTHTHSSMHLLFCLCQPMVFWDSRYFTNEDVAHREAGSIALGHRALRAELACYDSVFYLLINKTWKRCFQATDLKVVLSAMVTADCESSLRESSGTKSWAFPDWFLQGSDWKPERFVWINFPWATSGQLLTTRICGCGVYHSPHFLSLHWHELTLLSMRYLSTLLCYCSQIAYNTLLSSGVDSELTGNHSRIFFFKPSKTLSCPRRSVWNVCQQEHWIWEESGFKSSSSVSIIHSTNVKSGNTWSGQ